MPVIASVALFLLTSCATSLRAPLTGFVYNDTQAGEMITAQTASREGQACAKSFLGLVAIGDASIETARRNGGISSIAFVDQKFTSYLGLYATYCTVVRGR